MEKITFSDAVVTQQPYVTINGENYYVNDGTYSGGTNLNASTFNTMQNSIENAINSVVESGSNTNGSWIKYSDGTLIQRGYGSCQASVGYANITFPIAFYDTNYIMIANHKYIGGSDYGGSTQLRNITNPQANDISTAFIYSYYYDGTIATYARTVQYIAIGRWKA